MKQFCLAVVRNGRIEDVLVKLATINDQDDIKEALSHAVDEYFDQLEGEDGI